MDDRAFDRLTKVFATRHNRRSLVKSLLGLGGAAAVTAAAGKPGAAQIVGPAPQITPVPICPPSRICGNDCCGLSETCCNGVCCTGAEQCCDPPGAATAICLPDDACCRRADCAHLDDRVNCTVGTCNQQTHACEAVDGCDAKGLTCCPGKPRGACYDPKTECCPDCETGSCLTCVDGRCTGCERPGTCCVIGDVEICLDLTIEGACCTSADCGLEDPNTCQVSVCRDWMCEPASECLEGEEQCCGDHRCIPLDDPCPCDEQHPCPADETCCDLGDLGFCLDLTVPNICCTADTCGLQDPNLCIVSACIDFTCQPFDECVAGQQCCGNHTCIDIDDTCA